MRLNQNEEDLFKELEKIEFDFSLDDDLNDLAKEEKEKLFKEINNSEDTNDNTESEDLNNK